MQMQNINYSFAIIRTFHACAFAYHSVDTPTLSLDSSRRARTVFVYRFCVSRRSGPSTIVDPTTDHAQQLTSKLDSLDSEFRAHHLKLIDLIDDDPTLEKEQETLDKLDDDVSTLTIRLRQLIVRVPKSATSTSGDGNLALYRANYHAWRRVSI